MNQQLIEVKLSQLRKPFSILRDGSSQTDLNNTGRFGFLVERIFGIDPNNNRAPDFGHTELKTLHINRKMSIGTMSEDEHRKIINRDFHYFGTSEPYKKVKNTLLVVYEKLKSEPGQTEPVYVMHDWNLFSLENLTTSDQCRLQADYTAICEVIKNNSRTRDELTKFLRENGGISGDCLSLAYKGAGWYGYNYPAWSFQASFVKRLRNA